MKHKMIAAALALSPMLVACASPAQGDWVSVDRVASERNELSLDDDDKGDARIYYYYDDQAYYADFDVEWEDQGDSIVIDLECDGDCGSLDFELECELSGDDDDEMDCDGDGVFAEYRFEWKRD